MNIGEMDITAQEAVFAETLDEKVEALRDMLLLLNMKKEELKAYLNIVDNLWSEISEEFDDKEAMHGYIENRCPGVSSVFSRTKNSLESLQEECENGKDFDEDSPFDNPERFTVVYLKLPGRKTPKPFYWDLTYGNVSVGDEVVVNIKDGMCVTKVVRVYKSSLEKKWTEDYPFAYDFSYDDDYYTETFVDVYFEDTNTIERCCWEHSFDPTVGETLTLLCGDNHKKRKGKILKVEETHPELDVFYLSVCVKE